MPLLLDTHVWIWFADSDARLNVARKTLIEQTSANNLFVSAISVWEIAMLVHYGRLKLAQSPRAWVESSLKRGIRLIPFTAEIALESYGLPGEFHKDPTDRMIVATARQMGLTLMTQDKLLLTYAKKGYVRVA